MRRVVLAIVCLGLMALVVYGPAFGDTAFTRALRNVAHVPVFAVLAIVLLAIVSPRGGPRRPSAYLVSLAGALVLGALTELLQAGMPQREVSLGDVANDVLGAIVGLAFAAFREAAALAPHRRRLARILLALIAFGALAVVLQPLSSTVAAYVERERSLPDLTRFDTERARHFVRSGSSDLMPVRLPEPWGRPDDPVSLEVRLRSAVWPGLTLWEPEPDWRGYRQLLIDLTNPTQAPLELTLRIHDRAHDQRLEDRFNTRLTVPPGRREVFRIPLADVARAPDSRRLDLGAVDGVMIFARQEDAGRRFFITRIALER